jgi:hypothetical protein
MYYRSCMVKKSWDILPDCSNPYIYVTCFSSLPPSDRSFRLTCVISMPQKISRPRCVKCECLEHCFGELVSSQLFLLLLLKPYEGKTFLHLSHHMLEEKNIISMTNISETKRSSVVLDVSKL